MWLFALLMLRLDGPTARGTDALAHAGEPVATAETLRVTEIGSGDPVVLIPGLFGSAFAFRVVGPQLAAAGYRAVVVEPLGIGASARPEHADYSLTAQADRVAGELDRLGITRAVVVAHSIGASIAYRLAYRRPDLVRAVVSLEGGPAEAAATPGFRRAMQFAPWIKLFGGVRLVRRRIRSQLVRASGDPSWISDAVVTGYTAPAATDLDATLKAYVAMAHAREPERLEPHLAAIRCPVLLLLGGAPHDGGPRAADIAVLTQQLGTFATETVPGAGHFLYEERPGAVVSAVARVSGRGLVRPRSADTFVP
jgi:pimeloyl-ACP methyl ester carboxylesterase